MQAYDPVVLENERYTYHLLRRLVPAGSPTFYQYPRVPATALDLGCGTGLWLIDAARIWRASQLVGLDIVDVALPPLIDGSLPNVRLVRGDFLNYALPFADGAFELVRMANLGLCVPNDSWVGLLREVWRVLTPGGRVELIDDQMGFTSSWPPHPTPPRSARPSPVTRARPSTTPPPPSSATRRSVASAAPPPSPTPTPSAPSPATSAFELESVGPWSTQCAASRDLERVYMRMLTDSFGLPARPGALAMPLLARVFCRGRGGHWDAPPPSVLRTDSPEAAVAPSPSSKTITAAASARTITAAASTKTVTAASSTKAVPPLATVAPSRAESPQPPTPTHRTHTRGGSTASAVSTASSGAWSETGPHGVSHGRVQHPGLILWPATFIPMAPSELEMHTTKHMQTLLSCKPALAEYIGDYVDPATGARIVSEEAFEDAVWEYECFRRPRFNWPELPEARLESGEVSPDVPTPGSARSTHHVVPRTPTFVPDAKVTVGPYQSGELTHVRTFSVFGAVKDGPDATPFL
ncbi:hypothetical protein FB451DRAFT_1501722 [Mycena latifolia]|nr:hypothetical protein FB451DRAFT_1501722 [Mycena latifolia]